MREFQINYKWRLLLESISTEKLPFIRILEKQYGVAVNTLKKAINSLLQTPLIVSRCKMLNELDHDLML